MKLSTSETVQRRATVVPTARLPYTPAGAELCLVAAQAAEHAEARPSNLP